MELLKKSVLYFLVAWCAALHSCSQQPDSAEKISETQPVVNESFQPGKINPSVACRSNSANTYSLYLPAHYSDSAGLPVIIFFDPHGSGSYPLSLYKNLAEKFQYILIGSNTSKNGLTFDQTSLIAEELIEEAGSRFGTSTGRISMAGFSGGAKVALVSASSHPDLSSVIYCGAAIPFDGIRQLPPALGISGLRDLNYTEIVTSARQLNEKNIFHSYIEWNGKHEWPDSTTFENAFYWCAFNAMRNKSVDIDQHLIREFERKINASLRDNAGIIKQYNLYSQANAFLDGISDVSGYRDKLMAIRQSPSFTKTLMDLQSSLQTEISMKQNYTLCFETKDLNWWEQEVGRMKTINGGRQFMYQRLLGYLSLAAYSLSTNSLKQNNYSDARRFLSIYKVTDPENPEQPFLEACLHARQGNAEQAIKSLGESIRLGLDDKNKIETEESFTALRANPRFSELLSVMKSR